jgi:hypothetical protein
LVVTFTPRAAMARPVMDETMPVKFTLEDFIVGVWIDAELDGEVAFVWRIHLCQIKRYRLLPL